MNLIGPQIRTIRESRNLTQEELTARCNLAGWNISRGTLAKVESQVRRITDIEVEIISRALKVEVQDLFIQ
jgi:transcriptional regulator with XRE-family HTH domain